MPWLLHLCLPLGTEGAAAHIFRAAHDFRAERILRASVFLSIAFVCVLASLSHAQDPQPSDLLRETVPAPPIELLPGNSGSNAGGRWNEEMESLRERIQALEESVKSAQSASQAIVPGTGKTDSSKSDPSTPKPKDISSTKDKASDSNTGKPSEWVDVSSEKWTVKTGGHVQLDYVTWANAPPVIPDTFNYFNFRRLRLTADGTGYGVYDFRLQMTLEPEAITDNPALSVLTPQVKDAYFSLNEIPYLGRFRIGNFFVPFSLEQVTNDTNNAFLERSIPTQTVFAADREVGVALYNCTPEQNVTWTTGFFLDSISEGLKKRLDDNQGYRISGRGTWLPYYDEPSNGRYLVHTGLGVLSTNDQDNIVRFRTRPQVSEGPRLIDTGILLADTFTTGNFETAIVWGRFSVQSEAFLCNIHMLDNTTSTANGAYLYTSWFVTVRTTRGPVFSQCSLLELCCDPRWYQPGSSRIESPVVPPGLQQRAKRPIQRPYRRIQLVLERPYANHVRLDTSSHQRNDDLRSNNLGPARYAIRLQLVKNKLQLSHELIPALAY